MPEATEHVVLLDDDLAPVGTMDKVEVHTADTPLHLAFSCYIEDGAGRVLFTRRALGKRTWPGVWTNSCCGHPGPGEALEDAVRRRVRQELGMEIDNLHEALPDFRYRAESPEGVVENEFCPVFRATTRQTPRPDPAEVAEYTWVSWEILAHLAREAPRLISPWSAMQISQLNAD
jgi:isopentenyl-diphosphate Delta-isomerase